MLEILTSSLNEKGSGLIIILTVLILAITGSYKLVTDDIEKIAQSIDRIEKALEDDSEALHSLDKRVTILEIKNDRE